MGSIIRKCNHDKTVHDPDSMTSGADWGNIFNNEVRRYFSITLSNEWLNLTSSPSIIPIHTVHGVIFGEERSWLVFPAFI